jgi:probable rRNA maturation factor
VIAPPSLELTLRLESGDGAPLAAALEPHLAAAAGLAEGEAAEGHWQALMGDWLDQLTPELPAELRAPAYSLGLLITDDLTMADLNREWRQQEGPTDVLAFAAQEALPPQGTLTPWIQADLAEDEPLELGDIVISLETAARQAEEHDHTIERELRFLASHGLLHLLGWDHPDAPSLERMLSRQERLLARESGHLASKD